MSRDEEYPYCVSGLLAIPRVLVVPSDGSQGQRLANVLREAGFKPAIACDRVEVDRELNGSQVDLILIDEMLPACDGEHLVEYARRSTAASQVPLLVLSEGETLTRIRYHSSLEPFATLPKSAGVRALIDAIRRSISFSLLPAHPTEQSNELLRSRIIHTLSHEFRTPLLAINTGVELLIDNWQALGEAKVKLLLLTIKNGGARLQKLVNDFMTLQQIEVGLAQQAFNNSARYVGISDLLFSFMESKGCDYQCDGARIVVNDRCGGAQVRIVESQVIDCLDRLVSNAVKFSPSARGAEIVAECDGGNVWFNVKDRGMGIDLDSLQEAIGIFGQIGRDKLEQQGSGLGLSIANHFAAINGGRLGFQHRDGGGSIVSLVLPVAS